MYVYLKTVHLKCNLIEAVSKLNCFWGTRILQIDNISQSSVPVIVALRFWSDVTLELDLQEVRENT